MKPDYSRNNYSRVWHQIKSKELLKCDVFAYNAHTINPIIVWVREYWIGWMAYNMSKIRLEWYENNLNSSYLKIVRIYGRDSFCDQFNRVLIRAWLAVVVFGFLGIKNIELKSTKDSLHKENNDLKLDTMMNHLKDLSPSAHKFASFENKATLFHPCLF